MHVNLLILKLIGNFNLVFPFNFCCVKKYNFSLSFSRFLNCGWHGAKAWDMIQVYQCLPSEDLQRIEKLELLDEAELLTQLFQHYCISIAWTGNLFEDIEFT